MKPKLTVYHITIAGIWLVCLLLVGVGVLFISGPQTQALQQAQDNLRDNREQLEFARNAVRDNLDRQLGERLSRRRALLETFSCSATDESGLIFEIGHLAHTLGLNHFTSRSPDNTIDSPQDNKHIREAWLTVDFSADYKQTAAFINFLERHQPLLFVETIHLRRGNDAAQAPATQITLSYFVRQKPGEKEIEIAGAI